MASIVFALVTTALKLKYQLKCIYTVVIMLGILQVHMVIFYINMLYNYVLYMLYDIARRVVARKP